MQMNARRFQNKSDVMVCLFFVLFAAMHRFWFSELIIIPSQCFISIHRRAFFSEFFQKTGDPIAQKLDTMGQKQKNGFSCSKFV